MFNDKNKTWYSNSGLHTLYTMLLINTIPLQQNHTKMHSIPISNQNPHRDSPISPTKKPTDSLLFHFHHRWQEIPHLHRISLYFSPSADPIVSFQGGTPYLSIFPLYRFPEQNGEVVPWNPHPGKCPFVPWIPPTFLEAFSSHFLIPLHWDAISKALISKQN